jgi:hypothetical protein
LLSAGNCFAIVRNPKQKVRLAAVGLMGFGYHAWTSLLRTGLVELVALCDADADVLNSVNSRAKKEFPDLDFSKIPFYTDYRKLLDDAEKLGIDAMTVATPDHAHGPITIQAMKKGIHVLVEFPLVRTLWELNCFDKTARENGVVVQMGNYSSADDSLRRNVEVLQSGILGDVTEVHVWTKNPVWPQGKAVADWVKGHPNGDPVRKGLDWNAWLATAADRPFLDQYSKDAGVHDPWKLGKNVYHRFSWRGFFDFGCGALGNIACNIMNLPFRGLELGEVEGAICEKADSANDLTYPLKSVVKISYKARKSKIRPGVTLSPVTLRWYDGDEKPSKEVLEILASKNKGQIPRGDGCFIVGSKGQALVNGGYGLSCSIALDGDKEFSGITKHEAAKAVSRSIPFCSESFPGDKKAAARLHDVEFVNAILGKGPRYSQTDSRCFSDIKHCIPLTESVLIGCIAQRLPHNKLRWDSRRRTFDVANANAFIKPYIRKGFEF